METTFAELDVGDYFTSEVDTLLYRKLSVSHAMRVDQEGNLKCQGHYYFQPDEPVINHGVEL